MFWRKNQDDFGSPLYNLRISLNLNRVCFESDNGDTNPLLFISNLAEIGKFSMENLDGYRLVTDRGELVSYEEMVSNPRFRESQSRYPFLKATLIVNENETAMNRLIGAFQKGRKYDENEELRANLRYPSGLVQPICTKEGRLYLPIHKFNPLKDVGAKVLAVR